MSESLSQLQVVGNLHLESHKTRHDNAQVKQMTKNLTLNSDLTKLQDETNFSVGGIKTELTEYEPQIDLNEELDEIEQETIDTFKKLKEMDQEMDSKLKEIKNVAMKITFNRSDNISTHLLQIIKSKDSKIRELEDEILKLKDLRIKNDVLNNRYYNMQKKMNEMEEEINSFNSATTIARKVERDHQMFIHSLLNKNSKSSADYIHISKYNKLKEQYLTEKCHLKDVKKEIYILEKTIRKLRLSNLNLNETVKQFIRSSDVPSSPLKQTFGKSRRKVNKSIGGMRPTTPLKGSEISNFFIVKQLDKLEQHINNYKIFGGIPDSDDETDIRKISMKKIKLLNKYRNINSDVDDDTLSNEDEDKTNKLPINIRGVRNKVNLNQTLDMPKGEFVLN